MTPIEIVEMVARAIVPHMIGSQEDALGRDLPDLQFDDLTPEWQERCGEIAQAALTALQEAGLIPGPDEVIVPREPTEAMIHAGQRRLLVTSCPTKWSCQKVYEEMLAAMIGEEG